MKKRICLVACGIFLLVGIIYAETIVRIAPLTLSIKSSNTTVNTTATAIPTIALVGRESVAIYNINATTTTVYIGNSDVNSTNGFPLTSSCPSISLDLDNTVIIYAIVASGTADLRTVEAK